MVSVVAVWLECGYIRVGSWLLWLRLERWLQCGNCVVSVVAVWLECGNSVPSYSEIQLAYSVYPCSMRLSGYSATVAAKSVNRSVCVTELTVQ